VNSDSLPDTLSAFVRRESIELNSTSAVPALTNHKLSRVYVRRHGIGSVVAENFVRFVASIANAVKSFRLADDN
jgi:hypothetical protein